MHNIDGQPRGLIVPEKGLRQEDPLSPYLFILFIEVLIENIWKILQDKILTKMKVAQASLSISHLLFADDSLFFCKTTKEQCVVVFGILKMYE